MKITTTIDGNSLMIFYDDELKFNEIVSWYTDYAWDCKHVPELATADYLRYASAMGWR